MDLIENDPNISASQISLFINRNLRTVQRILSGLKEKNLVERIGGTRGYWKINNR